MNIPENILEDVRNLCDEDQRAGVDFSTGKIDRQAWIHQTEKRTSRIKEILGKYGIVKKQDNLDAYKGMLTLVLHSGDTDFLKQYLKAHREAGDRAVRGDEALVVDKIEALSGNKQIYGTQYKVENGNVVFLPISNEEAVNDRRALLGLGALEEYKNYIESLRRCA